MKDLVKMFSPQSQGQVEAAWIWKLPILPRMQLFIWKLLWECLPTCAMLVRRGLPIQPICPLCGLEEESTEHAIFSCPRASRIWQSVGYHSRLEQSTSQCSLFLAVLRKASQYKCALWASTAYQIWLSRNQTIFSDGGISYQRIIRKIRSSALDCARGSHSGGFDSPGLWGSPAASAANRHTVFISWEPPPPGFVKINFDGSVRGRLAGSAFVIRGPEGDLLAAGGFGSLDSSVPMSELYAAWEGISCAVRSLHVQNLIIEGDSMIVIRWLRREHGFLAPAIPLLADIWKMLNEAQDVTIRHSYREANAAADWVASAVAHHSGFWRWRQGDHCPYVLQQILYSDAQGVISTRVV